GSVTMTALARHVGKMTARKATMPAMRKMMSAASVSPEAISANITSSRSRRARAPRQASRRARARRVVRSLPWWASSLMGDAVNGGLRVLVAGGFGLGGFLGGVIADGQGDHRKQQGHERCDSHVGLESHDEVA